MYHGLYVKGHRFRKALKKILYNFYPGIATPERVVVRNKLFPFSFGGVESKKYECSRLEKFRMNTIETEYYNFVCSRVERTLGGAVENEEHLGA